MLSFIFFLQKCHLSLKDSMIHYFLFGSYLCHYIHSKRCHFQSYSKTYGDLEYHRSQPTTRNLIAVILGTDLNVYIVINVGGARVTPLMTRDSVSPKLSSYPLRYLLAIN